MARGDDDDIEIPGVGSASTRRRRRRVIGVFAVIAAAGTIALAVKTRATNARPAAASLGSEPNAPATFSPPPRRSVDIPDPPEPDDTLAAASTSTALASASAPSAA